MKFKKSFLLALIAPLFLCANPVYATNQGTVDCAATGTQTPITGSVNDTFTMNNSSGSPCQATYGSVTATSFPYTFTLASVGTTNAAWTVFSSPITSGSVSVTVTGGSSGTPSLSQWAQILLALLAVGTLAWYYRKQRQKH